jgi:hypothetical protein
MQSPFPTFDFFRTFGFSKSLDVEEWMDGWMGGWVDGWW